jgi:hypothetical protein
MKLWITSLNSHFPHQRPQPKMLERKTAESELRSVLWKVTPSLNSLYYLVVVKDRHFEPYAERFEHETPLWF